MFQSSNYNNDVSKWDTAKVTEMRQMFTHAEAFDSDISKWDVSQVSDMLEMFYGASAFSADISKWDVLKVTTIKNMFFGTRSLDITLCDHWKTIVTKVGTDTTGLSVVSRSGSKVKVC